MCLGTACHHTYKSFQAYIASYYTIQGSPRQSGFLKDSLTVRNICLFVLGLGFRCEPWGVHSLPLPYDCNRICRAGTAKKYLNIYQNYDWNLTRRLAFLTQSQKALKSACFGQNMWS